MAEYPHILVLGYSEAAMYLRTPDAADVAAIISIHGAQEFGVESQVTRRLDLLFDDVESPDESDPIEMYHARQRLAREAENGRVLCGPTPDDARAIIEFAESIRHANGLVLIHCGGGVSRAPAAAVLCLATWMGAGSEKSIVEYVRRIRPGAMPHGDLIRFGDRILDRRGALVAAIQ